MFKFLLEKPTILLVTILIICLFGIAAVTKSPIQMIPDLDPRIITIETRWPGASPNDVEKDIIIEQEEFLQNITGLERMLSYAQFGTGIIELEFPFGADINEALIRVNNALSQVPGYPENVDEPSISAESYSDNAFMFYGIKALDGYSGDRDFSHLYDWLQQNVSSRMERVPGVSRVNISGGVRRQVRIYIDPTELAARRLSLMDVREAIRARNLDISGGDMDFGKRRYMLRTIGRFDSIDSLNELIIDQRDGTYIRLSDIGYAELDYEETRSMNFVGGVNSISFQVRKEAGSNVVEIRERLNAEVERINRDVLAPMNIRIGLLSEDVRYVVSSTQNVIQNLILGGILSALTLMLFLRSFSGTLIGAIGIPICTLAAFLGIFLSGRSINVISLAGVAFAIGMTLDNSIVVLENITRHLAMGKSRFNAALEGVREVWPAVLASTLTTIMVFLPVILLEVEAGQLYSDIGIAIAASILMSMVVAITLVPAASSRFLPNTYNDQSGPLRGNAYIQRLTAFGSRVGGHLLDLCARIVRTPRLRLMTIGGTALVTLSTYLFFIPPAEYLPEGEEAKIFSFVFSPPGYNMEALHRFWEELDGPFAERLVNEEGEIPFDGESIVPPLQFHLSSIDPGSMMFISEPVERDHADETLAAHREIFRDVPGMRTFTFRGSIFSSTRGGTRSINVELSSADIEELFLTATKVLQRVNERIQGVEVNSTPSPPTLSMSQPIANVYPDWDRAAELGISQDDLGYTISAWSDGAFVHEFFQGDEKIDMYLYSTEGKVQSPRDLEDLAFITSDGEMIPLSTLASVRETVGTSEIPRINSNRTVTLNIIPPRSMALETGAEVVRQEILAPMMESGDLPESISVNITGASGALELTRNALSGNLLLSILIAYLLIVAVFSHWGFPLLIMLTVPVGIAGGVLGLNLFNAVSSGLTAIGLEAVRAPFDVLTMLGFLILIGTVVNNPILIVDRSVRNFEEGLDHAEAVLDAVKVRLRPIMMSTITTVFGLSPLVFLPGEGTELYRGVGLIVLCGLLVSSLVTLLVLPAFIATVLKLTNDWKNRRSGKAADIGAGHS